MFRTSIAVSLITAFSTIAAFAQDARQFTCTGTMIEPSAMSQSPETVVLTLGPGQKIALDLGKGVVSVRRLSDNKIQLKFRTKEFEGEYFHYTGDLFFIYKTGHLMKLMCQKHEVVRVSGSDRAWHFRQKQNADLHELATSGALRRMGRKARLGLIFGSHHPHLSSLDAAVAAPSLQPASSMNGPSRPTAPALARPSRYPRPCGAV